MKFKKYGKVYDQVEMMYAIMADEAMGKAVFNVAKLYGLDMISFMKKYPYAVALAFGFEVIKDTPGTGEAVENDGGDAKTDHVNRPAHYTSGGIECIDAMQAAFGADAVKDFCLCNAFKYLWRHRNKNGVEDLKKARWYLNRLITEMEVTDDDT